MRSRPSSMVVATRGDAKAIIMSISNVMFYIERPTNLRSRRSWNSPLLIWTPWRQRHGKHGFYKRTLAHCVVHAIQHAFTEQSALLSFVGSRKLRVVAQHISNPTHLSFPMYYAAAGSAETFSTKLLSVTRFFKRRGGCLRRQRRREQHHNCE